LTRAGTEKSLILDIPQGSTWRQLDLRYPILRCRHCGTKRNLRPDWLDITRPMTSRLVSMIEHESHNQTTTEVARRTGVDPRSISTIFDEAVKRWKPIVGALAPRRLGIDEAHIGGKDRGVVVDLDTGHLIAILEGRSAEKFDSFFATLEGREAVEVVAIDMTRLYASLAKQYFPNAEVVADRWHVTQMARAVVNTWRMRIRKPKAPQRSANRPDRTRTSQKKCPRQGRSKQPKPTVIRAMLQRRADRLTHCEREILGRVLAANHELSIAYEIRETLFKVFDEEDPKVADTKLTNWLNRVDEVVKDVPQLRAVANAVRAWRGPILAYWSTEWSTNGMTENTNGRIKRIHREGRTMSFTRLQAKVRYRLGGRTPMSIAASEMAWAIGTLIKQGWSMEEVRRQVSVYAAQILHPEWGLLDMPGKFDGW